MDEFNFWAFVGGLCIDWFAMLPIELVLGRLVFMFLVGHGPVPLWVVNIINWYVALMSVIPVVVALWAAQLIRKGPRAVKSGG
jgi:hypothetical protein